MNGMEFVGGGQTTSIDILTWQWTKVDTVEERIFVIQKQNKETENVMQNNAARQQRRT